MNAIWRLAFAMTATSLLMGQSNASSPSFGGLSGIVLDENGGLVDSANVCTSLASGNETAINCRVFTGRDGEFQIENLRFGTYSVFAINEAEGYSIENQTPGQEVKISAESPKRDMTIRLRPKGGVLIGSVRDKITGDRVHKINLQYIATDGQAGGGPSPAGIGDGEFQVTLPTECDLVIIVSAPGYEGWVYTDPSDPAKPVVHLAPGERKVLRIELEPKKTDSSRTQIVGSGY